VTLALVGSQSWEVQIFLKERGRKNGVTITYRRHRELLKKPRYKTFLPKDENISIFIR